MQTLMTPPAMTVAPLELKKLFIVKLHSIFLLDTLDMADAQAAIESIMSLYGVRFLSVEDIMEKRTEAIAEAEGIDYSNRTYLSPELLHNLKQDFIYTEIDKVTTTAEFFFEHINSRAHRNPDKFELECFYYMDFERFTQYPTV